MVVQHNMQAMNANRMLNVTTSTQAKATEKLSSGYKINRAADDAAGLTISEKMRKQIKGLDRASTNAEDGVSAVQTAEGALTEVHSMLQRMNELAVQASNGTNSESDRSSIQDEISQLTTEIDRVAETTKFNETYLLKGDVNDATKTNTIAAHDAGLDGKLVDNGNGTSTFTAKTLAVGDKVSIAGKEYKIGKSADSADYQKVADAKAAVANVGDSVTSNGVTTTLVNKVTTAAVNGLGAKLTTAGNWDNGNSKITTADGTVYTYTTADGFKNDADANDKVALTDVTKLLKDGATITGAAAAGDLKNLNGVLIVDDLGKNEASIISDKTTLQDSIKAGDTVTVSGVTKTVTAEDPKTLAEIATDPKLDVVDSKVSIGSKEYTIKTSTDLDKGEITKDDFLAMIKDGDKVGIGANAAAKDYYTAIVKASDDDSITLDEAYSKMAEELKTASSIGTDTAATVKNNGNGTFEITQGKVTVKDALSFSLHVGADADMTNKINVDIETMSAAGLGI
ncbi:MAG: flagellar hook protein [Lachnospiraceae bacterium]|nr:flagellar hook protein [Lachnospiraceae bacterium]